MWHILLACLHLCNLHGLCGQLAWVPTGIISPLRYSSSKQKNSESLTGPSTTQFFLHRHQMPSLSTNNHVLISLLWVIQLCLTIPEVRCLINPTRFIKKLASYEHVSLCLLSLLTFLLLFCYPFFVVHYLLYWFSSPVYVSFSDELSCQGPWET